MRVSRDSAAVVDTDDIVAAFVDAWGPPLPSSDRGAIAGLQLYRVGRWRRGPVDVRVHWMRTDAGLTHVTVQFDYLDDYAERIRPWRP